MALGLRMKRRMKRTYREGPESFIYFGAKKILIDDLIRLNHGVEPTQVRVSDILNDSMGNTIHTEEARVDAADTSFPIILLKPLPSRNPTPSPLLLDGTHRVVKAKRLNQEFIPAHFITPRQLRSVMR